MTTETTPIDRAMLIIQEQRKLIESYKTLIESYNKREGHLTKYLETIYALLETGIIDPRHIKEAQLGLDHLDRLITRMQKNNKKEV